MPTQAEKLQAHAAHLLDGFLGLREKYAMLEPMLFDQAVVNTYGTSLRARGFQSLKNTLFLACSQEITKLALDADPRSPSVKNIVDAIAAMDHRERAEQSLQFDVDCDQLIEKWRRFSAAGPMSAFKTIRDKVSAHTDVHWVDGEYKLVDVAALGIKWTDLRETIKSLQELVELIGFVVRGSSFSWDSLDRQLAKVATGFWSVPIEW